MAVTLSGSVALVTGANRGIGRALVEELAEKGVSKIYAAARNINKLEELKASLGEKVIPLELDVTVGEQIDATANSARDVDLLVNNAGVAGQAGVAVIDPQNLEIARRELDVNLLGTLAVSQAFAPILAANGGGGLVNIVSVAALVNFPIFATYSTTKAALHSLTQALRLGLKEQGTYVAGVYPGPVDTDLAAQVPMDKTSPNVVATNILNGIAAGLEEIFPDPMAAGMGAGYEQSPKGLEQQVAQMVAELAAQAA